MIYWMSSAASLPYLFIESQEEPVLTTAFGVVLLPDPACLQRAEA
jgi:hypothetical protein